MNDKTLYLKNDLLDWLLSIEDESVIKKLDDFRNELISLNQIMEPKTEYYVKDDFDERFAKGIPHEEMKRRTVEYIRSLPWKK